jgi:hypothetical protein
MNSEAMTAGKRPRRRRKGRIHAIGGNAACGQISFRRGDKNLLANKRSYPGKSYRDAWKLSGSHLPFAAWASQELSRPS